VMEQLLNNLRGHVHQYSPLWPKTKSPPASSNAGGLWSPRTLASR
jgi:hypothetical protein